MPHTDPTARREYRRRAYLRDREKRLAYQAAWRAALNADQGRAKDYKRRQRNAARSRFKAKGLTIRGTERKHRPPRARDLWEQNARQAWRWWLRNCPPDWRRAYRNAMNRHRYATSPRYAIGQRVKKWMNKHLRKYGLQKQSKRWSDKLGWTPQQLHDHLESLFVDGMGWHNMGAWHIDHVRPIASFTFTASSDVQFLECYALANLQPLWARDNLRKGKSYCNVRC